MIKVTGSQAHQELLQALQSSQDRYSTQHLAWRECVGRAVEQDFSPFQDLKELKLAYLRAYDLYQLHRWTNFFERQYFADLQEDTREARKALRAEILLDVQKPQPALQVSRDLLVAARNISHFGFDKKPEGLLFSAGKRSAFSRFDELREEAWVGVLSALLVEFGVTVELEDPDGLFVEAHGPVRAMFHGQSFADLMYSKINAEFEA